MAKFETTFDANGIEPILPLEVLPPGKYIAQIVRSEMRLTKDGTGQYLFVEIDVLEGPYQGRKLFDRLNLVNASTQTVEMAQRTLSAICHATGCMLVEDSEALHLIPFVAVVQVQPPKNGYGETNKIRYQPLDQAAAAPPATPPAAPPLPAAPAPQSRPGSGGSTVAPWKRST